MYVIHKLIIFFVCGSIVYMFWNICVSQSLMQPLPNLTPDNQEYTVIYFHFLPHNDLG